MNPSKNLTRRDFIFYIFSTFIVVIFLDDYFKKESINISNYLKSEIELYNSNRDELLKKNISLAIKNDLENNRTIWIGKRLFTYAEINKLNIF